MIEKINGNEPQRYLPQFDITFYFRNASNPDQTRSHEVQLVWLDEVAQMEEGVMQLTNAALRQFGDNCDYQTMLTGTPRGRNWLFRWFRDPATLRYPPEKVSYYECSLLEAIEFGIVREGYLEEFGLIPGSDAWRTEVLAEFITSVGHVFNEFDRRKHCPEPFTHPKLVAVYGGVDVGYGGYTALELSGVTSEGAMYTFDEFYVKRALPETWMARAAAWTAEHNVREWYVDAAANIEIKAMRSAGLPVKASMKAKDAAGAAVSYINSKLARGELFVNRQRCPFLVGEIETYIYKEQVRGDEVTFLEKVKPGQADHAIDAWRYHIAPLSAHAARSGNDLYQKVRYG